MTEVLAIGGVAVVAALAALVYWRRRQAARKLQNPVKTMYPLW